MKTDYDRWVFINRQVGLDELKKLQMAAVARPNYSALGNPDAVDLGFALEGSLMQSDMSPSHKADLKERLKRRPMTFHEFAQEAPAAAIRWFYIGRGDANLIGQGADFYTYLASINYVPDHWVPQRGYGYAAETVFGPMSIFFQRGFFRHTDYRSDVYADSWVIHFSAPPETSRSRPASQVSEWRPFKCPVVDIATIMPE